MKPKREAMRQCMGCREMKPKRELIRVVRSPQGEVSIDFRGKMPGRGAYVCRDAECLKRALKTKAFDRAFGVSVPEDVYGQLKAQLENDEDVG